MALQVGKLLSPHVALSRTCRAALTVSSVAMATRVVEWRALSLLSCTACSLSWALTGVPESARTMSSLQAQAVEGFNASCRMQHEREVVAALAMQRRHLGKCGSLRMSRHDESVPEKLLINSIEALGYQLEPTEVAWLAQRIGQGEDVRRSTLAAAHIDWPALLQDHRQAPACVQAANSLLINAGVAFICGPEGCVPGTCYLLPYAMGASVRCTSSQHTYPE